VHGLNVLGLESEIPGGARWHHGATVGPPPTIPHATARCRQIRDGHEELKAPGRPRGAL
jgi:hypothetical protein